MRSCGLEACAIPTRSPAVLLRLEFLRSKRSRTKLQFLVLSPEHRLGMKRSFSRLQRTRHSWTLPSRTLTSSFSWGPSRISLLDKRTRTVDSPHVRGFTTTGNPQPQRTEVEAWRHPSESYHEKHLLFQTDKVIKDRYIASYGKIRLGNYFPCFHSHPSLIPFSH